MARCSAASVSNSNFIDTDFKEYLDSLGFSVLPWGQNSAVPEFTALPGRVRLVFVGEAPSEVGKDNSFAGADGELLAKMILAMGLKLSDVAVTHVVSERNEDGAPTAEEREQNLPGLLKLLATLNPDVVVTLGQVAAHTLLQSNDDLPTLRGNFLEREHLKRSDGKNLVIVPTFHPAYLLREPSLKKAVWEDLQKIMAFLSKNVSKNVSENYV